MLFPKFVPSCSQSWALFCIWNVRNALLHSLSHLDTLTCKGRKEHENTAGARRAPATCQLLLPLSLEPGCELGRGCCSASRWLWAAACLPSALQASRSCTKSMWRCSAGTCPAGRGVTARPSAAWAAHQSCSSCSCPALVPPTHLSCVQSNCWVGIGNQCRDEFSLWMWGENWLWEWVWFLKGFVRAAFQGQDIHAKSTMDTLNFLLL